MVSEYMPDRMPPKKWEWLPDCTSEYVLDRMPKIMSDRMPHKASGCARYKFKLWESLLYSQNHDLCYRNCVAMGFLQAALVQYAQRTNPDGLPIWPSFHCSSKNVHHCRIWNRKRPPGQCFVTISPIALQSFFSLSCQVTVTGFRP